VKISDATVARVRDQADIAAIVGETVALHPAGKDLVGLCPFHAEKSPSFTVCPAKQMFYCFGCGKGGDVLDFLQAHLGLSFPDAVRHAAARCGVDVETADGTAAQPVPRVAPKPPAAPAWSPDRRRAPDATWIEHAAKLVDWAHAQLLGEAGTAVRAWLWARGIDAAAVERFKLGWNPGRGGKDLYRERKSWGLPDEMRPDGRAKKLWIPRGLVIPLVVDGDVWRVRIRREENTGPRYYVLPGSSMRQLVAAGGRPAAVVVESELDAVMLAAIAGDLVTAVGLGSASARPDADAHALLADAVRILVSLDYDGAGKDNWQWWRAHYRQAKRYPTSSGKDPGEAYQSGSDIRAWIIGGLPEAWTDGLSVFSCPAVEGRGDEPDYGKGVEADGEGPGENAQGDGVATAGEGVEPADGGGGAAALGASRADGHPAALPGVDGVHVAGVGPRRDGRHGGQGDGAVGQPAGGAEGRHQLRGPVGVQGGGENNGACEGGGDAGRQPAVAELIDILRRHPVAVRNTDDRLAIEPLRDGWSNPEVLARLSRLVFFDEDVAAWLDGVAAEEITGGNIGEAIHG
jgi:hypothetical protein